MLKIVVFLAVATGLLGAGTAGLAGLRVSAPAPEAIVEPQTTAGVPAKVSVLTIANGGKFLGDDIGGAMISIRDARTQELLAAGRTHGGSGVSNLPDIPV